jgi:hypothetical protein
MPNSRAAALIAAFALSACGAGAVPTSSAQPATALPIASGSSPATDTVRSPIATESSAPTATPAATPVGPAAGVTYLLAGCDSTVARCQDMPAGTYETFGRFPFLPGLTLTLPAGWSAGEQDAGEFSLHQASDPDQANAIFFWSDLVPWVGGSPRPDLGTSADEFADYLLTDERLTVDEGPIRTFRMREPDSLDVAGTVQARSLSVIVSDDAQTDPDLISGCPGQTQACVNVFIDPDHWPGPASLGRNIDAPAAGCPCSQGWRLYIASIGGELDPHMLVVAVETVGRDPLAALSDWESQVEPIIASVLIPAVVINN